MLIFPETNQEKIQRVKCFNLSGGLHFHFNQNNTKLSWVALKSGDDHGY